MQRVVEAAEEIQTTDAPMARRKKDFGGNCASEEAKTGGISDHAGQTKSDRKERYAVKTKIGPRLVGGGRLTWNAFWQSKCVANTLRL
jgi:hypothetical protein